MATAPITSKIVPTSAVEIQDPTGGALPWSVATISTATVTTPGGASFQTENVTYYLRGASGLSNGAISADYVLGTDGKTLIPTDVISYLPSGGLVATYYGSEANNPALAPSAAVGSTPGFSAANPGYLYTQYTYAPGGTLVQVIAAQQNGKVFLGTGAIA